MVCGDWAAGELIVSLEKPTAGTGEQAPRGARGPRIMKPTGALPLLAGGLPGEVEKREPLPRPALGALQAERSLVGSFERSAVRVDTPRMAVSGGPSENGGYLDTPQQAGRRYDARSSVVSGPGVGSVGVRQDCDLPSPPGEKCLSHPQGGTPRSRGHTHPRVGTQFSRLRR